MAKKRTWKRKIKKACEEAGTYRTYFDPIIDTLAGIMETRDNAQENFRDSGGSPIVIHKTRNGASNVVKNPALVIVNDMNQTALAYWRDLGLTPSGLRKIDQSLMKGTQRSGFAEILESIGI